MNRDPSVELHGKPRQRDGVLAQQADEELVLLDVQAGSYFALNEVGARVWELCDGSHSVQGILEQLGEEFDAPPDVIERDVHELLEDLARDRLLAW